MKKKEEKASVPAKAKINLPAVDLAETMAKAKVTGFENVRAGDTAIPFICILQSLSPQVKKEHASRIPGAEEGMFFNNVTQEVFKPPIAVVPCAFQKAYVEWVPREKGGGFVAQHQDERLLASCKRDDKNNDVLPNGNHLVTTAYHFVLLKKADGSMERAVVSMTKTQLKKSRRWMSQMMAIQMRGKNGQPFRPPMFSHSYAMRSALETRDNYSWYGFQVSDPEAIQDMPVYMEAARFNTDILGGLVRTTPPPTDEAAAEVPGSM